MRISKNPEERRNEILDVAETLFTTKGYANTTINDILQMVGIAKGTFYYYFRSKEDVMDAVVIRFIDSGTEAAKMIAANANLEAPEKIFQIIMAQNPNASREKRMLEELHDVHNAEMHQKSLVETIRRLTPVLTDVVEQGIAEGSFTTPYPKEMVEFLLVAQLVFDDGIFEWQPQELMQKATAFTHMIETSLGAKTGSFAYLHERLMQASKNPNEKGEESSE
ncbi:TetR/AcrR family transcriptional regulator [Salicibibacter cibarius]|uniref:TetR/AcrR family transcriptional regulator n=1 Tax=Salicibibacter cibarius TaxID=2743000 RepID=A0A7T7CAH1_9BACI|nr:TetR/AcrR family transcriptional regulator [Salicibibacter cibarius]QQK74855.1 TetR/AcrR family transcriptional regulator [Salicibibacter cibarius]